MTTIQETMKQGILRFDGGFGSMMAARGVKFDCPERLNLTNPEDVRAIHRAYAEAGSQVVTANSLGANPVRLRAHALEADCERIVEAAIGHVLASGAPFAACSVGTTAEFLAPFGMLSFEEAYRGYLRQMMAAKNAGAHLIFCETLTDAAETRAMLLAAKETGLPYAASFTFSDNGRTLTGSTPAICAQIAQALGASIVGVNCVGDGALLARIVAEMHAATVLPVIAQPNAGLPDTVDGKLCYHTGPEEFVPMIEGALKAGASIIGGCCGTTPDHIRRIAPLLKAAPLPAPGGSKETRICSLRASLTVDEAKADCEEMAWDEIDSVDAAAAVIDLTGATADDVDDMMDELQMLIKEPVIFRGGDDEVLAAALRRYPGVAGVEAGTFCGYGAVNI